jgi:hypothetical protein
MITILSGAFAHADNKAQSTVESFLADHSPMYYRVFCRDRVQVPECRTLTTFVRNTDGNLSEAFQISFSAPAKPFAATELFIPTKKTSSKGSGQYNNYVDKTMNGKFTVAATGRHEVVKGSGEIFIKGLAFGTLLFTRFEAVVTLKDENQIFYSEMIKK